MTGTHKRRAMDLKMKEKTKKARKADNDKAERLNRAWDLVSDLNPY